MFFSAQPTLFSFSFLSHYKMIASSKSPFSTQQPVHIVYSWNNSQCRWQKCKWYRFLMINQKSFTASTSCTSPGSLITEHGSSILSLKIENQPKFSTRKMSYWLLDVVGKTNQPVQIFPGRLPIPPPARVPAHSSTKQQGQKHKTWWKTDWPLYFANMSKTTSSNFVKGKTLQVYWL